MGKTRAGFLARFAAPRKAPLTMQTHACLRLAAIGAYLLLFSAGGPGRRLCVPGEFRQRRHLGDRDSRTQGREHDLLAPFLDDVTPSHDGRVLYINRYDSVAAGDRHMAESGEVIAVSTETEQALWRTRSTARPIT